MEPSLLLEFRNYLETQKIDFSARDSFFYITQPSITIRVVGKGELVDSQGMNADITIYEDEWYTKFPLIANRLMANLGRQRSFFARNCVVQAITTETAKEFLNLNHILGYAKSRYKYGLFTKKDMADVKEETLVAVALFSATRPMDRQGRMVQSYEWVRYASLANFRIVGGMGKLMSCFVDSVKPEEIMSYADKDWGKGEVYRKLGFKYLCDTPPIEFYVNKESLERISKKKLLNHPKFEVQKPDLNDYYLLRNQGNLKFLWTSPFAR